MPPAGRGGAGNYEQIRLEKNRAAEDIEAQKQNTDQFRADASQPPKGQTQPFAYTGRGGAGNFHGPNVISHIKAEAAQPAVEPVAVKRAVGQFHGRGGAGNLLEASAASDAGPGESIEKMQLRETAEKAVEINLPRPEQVHVSGSKLDRRDCIVDI